MKRINNLVVLFVVGINYFSFADSLFTQENNGASEFMFYHKLSRLYSMHTAQVMNSLDFSLSLGGAFGFEENGFLGTLALGLGGFGEIEATSASIMGTIFGREEYFGNIGLKIKIIDDATTGNRIALGIRTNNSWNTSNSNESDIREVSPTSYNDGLRYVRYDSRSTNLYAAFATTHNKVHTFHAGLGITDLRWQNINVIFKLGNYSLETEQRKNLINYFFGYELLVNSRTRFLVEATTIPIMEVNTGNGKLSPELQFGGVVGIRFFVTKWLVLDTGLRYQENYSGIADAQIKIGLNGIWSVPQ